MQEVDLLIIGGGPAGLSTALHLLKQDAGWAGRMVVIEKTTHPRPKLCAGGVTRIGLDTLRDLGLQLPLPIPGVEIEEARIIYKDSTISVRSQLIFMVYNRIEFDAFLSQYARQQGVGIHENEAVQGISIKPQGVEVTTSQNVYRAEVVVGADGSKGITRKLIKEFGSKSRVARVLEMLFPAQGSEAPFAEAFATFNFTSSQQDLQGYYWEFPSKVEDQPHFNRGVYDSRFVSGRERADLPAILTAQINNDHESQSDVSFQGHPVHLFHPGNRFALHRMLLVGDVAGVDSLFGEGIGPALAYGKLAAKVISRAFQLLDFSFSDYKRRLLFSRLGRYLLYRWFIAWLSYHLSGSSLFMDTSWVVAKIVAALWPKPGPIYTNGSQKDYSASSEKTNDYIH